MAGSDEWRGFPPSRRCCGPANCNRACSPSTAGYQQQVELSVRGSELSGRRPSVTFLVSGGVVGSNLLRDKGPFRFWPDPNAHAFERSDL